MGCIASLSESLGTNVSAPAAQRPHIGPEGPLKEKGKGVKTRDEDDFKRASRCFARLRGKLRLVDRSHALALRLKKAIKFLLFVEENPRHRVTQNTTAIRIMLAVFAPLSLVTAYMLLLAYSHYGSSGFFTAYVSFTVATIEIPHILLDR